MTRHGLSETAGIALRQAKPEDMTAMDDMIFRAVRQLMPGHYTQHEMEGFQPYARADRQLVRDGTCFVAEIGGRLAGCGGWSFRGLRRTGQTEPQILDPQRDRAMMRAFFTHPDFARRGVGRALLAASEAEAARAGFREGELIATPGGRPLYESSGWAAIETMEMAGACGTPLPAILMRKRLA